MKEYEYSCNRCGKVWYATLRDRFDSTMKSSYIDYNRCPDCHSRNVNRSVAEPIREVESKSFSYRDAEYKHDYEMHDKAEHYPQDNGADYYTASPQQQYRDTTPKRLQSAMTKFLITLTVVFMPYIGFFLIIFKRPYSKKASMVAITYCILLSVFVFINMGKSFERVSESNSNVPEVGSVEPIMPTINQPTPQPTREAVPTPTPTPIPTQTPKKDTLYDVQLWYEGMKPEVAHTFEINFADMYSASITNVRIAETKLYFSSDFGCFFEVYFKCTYDGKKCEGFAWAFLEYLDDKITWWCIEVDYGWDALIEDFNDYYDDYVEDYYNELVRQYG